MDDGAGESRLTMQGKLVLQSLMPVSRDGLTTSGMPIPGACVSMCFANWQTGQGECAGAMIYFRQVLLNTHSPKMRARALRALSRSRGTQ